MYILKIEWKQLIKNFINYIDLKHIWYSDPNLDFQVNVEQYWYHY